MKPKLDVKIGTKEEAIWTKVKEEAGLLIEQSENNLIVQKDILLLAETNIRIEQDKMKEADKVPSGVG